MLLRVWAQAWFTHTQIHWARWSWDAGRWAAWRAALAVLLQCISHAKLCFKTSSFTFNQIPIICCWAVSVCDSWLYTHAYTPTGDRWISLLISDFLSMCPRETLQVMQRHHYQETSVMRVSIRAPALLPFCQRRRVWFHQTSTFGAG